MFAAECEDRGGFICANGLKKYHIRIFLAGKGAQHLIVWIVQGHSASQVFSSREWNDTKILC